MNRVIRDFTLPVNARIADHTALVVHEGQVRHDAELHGMCRQAMLLQVVRGAHDERADLAASEVVES